VELESVTDLFELKPNLSAIVGWGKLQAINGIYVYLNNSPQIIGRNFNHLDPLLEDSATGVAAGALCAYLQRDLEVHQGQNLNNHCLINAYYSPDQILISGQVYTFSN
jgi:Predicted epimerase, PhzC/PhzF homolog